jgi:hypothetical protein
MYRFFVGVSLCLLMLGSPAFGGVKSSAVREAAEYVAGRFSKEVGKESVEALSMKIGQYAARHGDDAIRAIRKIGPRAFTLVDEAGENAPNVIKLINRYGNRAVWVAASPRNLAMFAKYGDEAAAAMIKHPGITAPVIEKFGSPAAKAMGSVSSQNARRLVMLADDGTIAATSKADQVFATIGKYGDRAADWIWRNKGALAATAVATAFVANPEPFLDGAVEIVGTGADAVVRPVVDIAARAINWNLLAMVAVVVGGIYFAVRLGLGWVPKRVWRARANRNPSHITALRP